MLAPQWLNHNGAGPSSRVDGKASFFIAECHAPPSRQELVVAYRYISKMQSGIHVLTARYVVVDKGPSLSPYLLIHCRSKLTGGECRREENAQGLISDAKMVRSWSNWHLLACDVSHDEL